MSSECLWNYNGFKFKARAEMPCLTNVHELNWSSPHPEIGEVSPLRYGYWYFQHNVIMEGNVPLGCKSSSGYAHTNGGQNMATMLKSVRDRHMYPVIMSEWS